MNLSGHLSSFTDKQLDLSLTSQTIAFLEISSDEAEVILNVLWKLKVIFSFILEVENNANNSNLLQQWTFRWNLYSSPCAIS